MTFNPDDPKYTAYVVGELDDTERQSIDSELEANPEAAALVAEIRAATEQISAALKAEPLPALTAGQRETVLKAEGGKRKAEEKFRRPVAWLAALAASLLLAAAAGWAVRGITSSTNQEVTKGEGLSHAIDWALAVTDPNQSQATDPATSQQLALNWARAVAPPTAWGDNLGGDKIQLDSMPVACGRWPANERLGKNFRRCDFLQHNADLRK